MRKLRVVFDGLHGVFIQVNVLADDPADARRVAIDNIDRHFPQSAGVLDGVTARYYDASDAPLGTHFLTREGTVRTVAA